MIWRSLWHMEVLEVVFGILLAIIAVVLHFFGVSLLSFTGLSALVAAALLCAGFVLLYRVLYRHW